MPDPQTHDSPNQLTFRPPVLLRKFEAARIFSEREAWMLFRLAAIGEAVGWSLLIAGILLKRFWLPHSNAPVLIAGQVHGTLFLIYVAAAGVLYASLGWSRKRMLVAGLASVPPYGSLVFERWAARKRMHKLAQAYRKLTVRVIVPDGKRVLAIQPKDSRFWYLPGGTVPAGESAEQALERIVRQQTGIGLDVGSLAYVRQYRAGKVEQLELFFRAANPADFTHDAIRAAAKFSRTLDGLLFVDPSLESGLRPIFLGTEPIAAIAADSSHPAIVLTPGS